MFEKFDNVPSVFCSSLVSSARPVHCLPRLGFYHGEFLFVAVACGGGVGGVESCRVGWQTSGRQGGWQWQPSGWQGGWQPQTSGWKGSEGGGGGGSNGAEGKGSYEGGGACSGVSLQSGSQGAKGQTSTLAERGRQMAEAHALGPYGKGVPWVPTMAQAARAERVATIPNRQERLGDPEPRTHILPVPWPYSLSQMPAGWKRQCIERCEEEGLIFSIRTHRHLVWRDAPELVGAHSCMISIRGQPHDPACRCRALNVFQDICFDLSVSGWTVPALQTELLFSSYGEDGTDDGASMVQLRHDGVVLDINRRGVESLRVPFALGGSIHSFGVTLKHRPLRRPGGGVSPQSQGKQTMMEEETEGGTEGSGGGPLRRDKEMEEKEQGRDDRRDKSCQEKEIAHEEVDEGWVVVMGGEAGKEGEKEGQGERAGERGQHEKEETGEGEESEETGGAEGSKQKRKRARSRSNKIQRMGEAGGAEGGGAAQKKQKQQQDSEAGDEGGGPAAGARAFLACQRSVAC